MMSNATELAKMDLFKNVLRDDSMRKQLQSVFGDKDTANAFVVSMLDLYSSDTFLQSCNPQEVAQECMKAAILKLPLAKSLGFAYVVPYKNKPTFTIGYKGLIQLAQRTGHYVNIHADVVYDGELRRTDKLTGLIDLSGERKSDVVTGYFAYIEMTTGFKKTLYMSRQEAEDWGKKYSPSYNGSYSPWRTEFDKMALKTVLRRLIKTYGEMSTDSALAKAVTLDNVIDEVNQTALYTANQTPIDTPLVTDGADDPQPGGEQGESSALQAVGVADPDF